MAKRGETGRKRRVAISLDLKWLFGRHTEVFAGTQRYAQGRGNWDCIVDEFLPASLPADGRGPKPYDGIIARADEDIAALAKRCRIPLVNVWYNANATDVPAVFPDFPMAGRLAAEHLLERGLRQVGCLSDRRDRAHNAILDGFHQALREAGVVCCCAKTTGTMPPRTANKWNDFQETVGRWMKLLTRPAGVLVAYNDITNRHVASAFRRGEWRIPEDVAMIAGVNESAVCLNPPPTLTGIEFGHETIGFEAARLLDNLMDGATPPDAPLLLPTSRIVARQSTDFVATSDGLVSEAYRFLADNFAESLSVGDIAIAVHTTRRTLERRFRAATGRTVAAELHRIRIEYAKRLLLDSDSSIKRIARQTGFSNSTQFGQVFRRLNGVSPSEFRRKSPRVEG